LNKREQTEIRVPQTCLPKEISQQCTNSTHTEAVHHQEIILGSSSYIVVFDQ